MRWTSRNNLFYFLLASDIDKVGGTYDLITGKYKHET